MRKVFDVMLTVDPESLAAELATYVGDRSLLIDFVLMLDGRVAELDFTKKLHHELGKIIEAEEAGS